MRKFLVVTGAVMAGIILTPQARINGGLTPARHEADATNKDVAKTAARHLRKLGYWGFGKARVSKGHLYLQANRGQVRHRKSHPVMIKMDLDTRRIVAVKSFANRHVRSGIALNQTRPAFG